MPNANQDVVVIDKCWIVSAQPKVGSGDSKQKSGQTGSLGDIDPGSQTNKQSHHLYQGREGQRRHEEQSTLVTCRDAMRSTCRIGMRASKVQRGVMEHNNNHE
jgi:hypothetical protein